MKKYKINNQIVTIQGSCEFIKGYLEFMYPNVLVIEIKE